VTFIGPISLVVNCRSSSTVNSSKNPASKLAALLTSTSMRPNRRAPATVKRYFGGRMRIRSYASCFAALAEISLGVSASVRGQAVDTQRNRQVIQTHLDLMNRGEWRQAAEYFAEDVRHHRGNWQDGAESIVRGKKALIDNLEDIFRTCPDWKMEIVEIASDGDSVIVRCRVSGTPRGVATRGVNGGLLVGVQPNGKHFQVQHIH
jgi:predicted SnoaL-like aldol condensation-catalyzing enzyme